MAQQMKTSLITTDNTNEDIQQIQIYAKDSLDRFGDDLCSLLLSYFTFEDRFRYECVSKQFQRTVFESVIDITINDNFILKLMLKLLLTKTTTPYEMAIIAKKCPNIETIDCRGIIFTHEEHTLEVLNTFRDNCPHLRHIYCDIRPNTCQLFPTFGRLVTKINVIQSWNESVKQSLNETLKKPINEEVLEPLKLCHRLTHLSLYFEEMSDKLSLNCGKHWPRLQCLSIGNNEITVECLDHISRLPALKTLELHILCGIALRDSDIEDLFFKSPKLIPFLSS
ncbi:unnamed protein product [Medioppia subpectinata]|uniref:Uncharacterized protein n=1 Tax=Medioppia subpectinata TaxID=1979941 RepID=A0A7R9L0X8_9ACAR|nr:unnamed protein product [Medioppia subpectinata]CAG2112358.1 unnamed protein product [Medioppia subpectinata]